MLITTDKQTESIMLYLVIVLSSSDDARGESDIADMVQVGTYLFKNEDDADAAKLEFEDMLSEHFECETDYYVEKRLIAVK